MKIKPLILHTFFGLGVVLIVTVLAVREVLVTPTYTPLPTSQFFKPETYTQLLPKPVPTNYESKSSVTSTVSCTPYCSIIVTNLADNSQVASVSAFNNASHEPAFKEIALLFVDEKNKFLSYQTPDNEIYVVGFDMELLQTIRLENERNTVQYLGYFQQTRQMAFELIEKSGGYKQLALYAADRPSLYLLEKVPLETQISVGQNNTIKLGTQVIDLQGKKLTN